MKKLPVDLVAKARAIPLLDVLEDLGYYVSRDAAFEPRKSKRTMSVFVSNDADVRELILTGEKWFDKRAEVGGGGAIDLVMHLEGLTFRRAVEKILGLTQQASTSDNGR